MPRERFRDDNREDYDEQPRSQSGGNRGLIIGLIVGGVLLLVCLPLGLVGLALLGFGWAGPAANAPAPVAVADAPTDAKKSPMGKGMEEAGPPKGVKIFNLTDFELLVLKKHKDAVIVSVGRPDDIETIESDPIVSAKWFYRNRVLNPETGKPYPLVTVWLDPTGTAFSVERPR